MKTMNVWKQLLQVLSDGKRELGEHELYLDT